MNCAGCRRELNVGDQYIQFTASAWAEREGLEPMTELDDIFAGIMGSNHGGNLVYCEDCTQQTNNAGWMLDTVYGEEQVD